MKKSFFVSIFIGAIIALLMSCASFAPQQHSFLDMDRDGVIHRNDQCPETPVGAKVDAAGCWMLPTILFNSGDWTIKKASYADLDELIAILKKNPRVILNIQGYTDDRGSREANQALSQKRANEVMAYLIKKCIAPERLSAYGLGLSSPVSDNDTMSGQAMNRRVEIKVVPNKYWNSYVKEKYMGHKFYDKTYSLTK